MRYDDQGNVRLDARQVPAFASPPPVVRSTPLPPHALENVGDADLHLISVEVKDTPLE